MQKLTNAQARRFMLIKHGLSGEHRFVGKDGIMCYANSVGCMQFDPIDVCSRTADISLNARIKGYTKAMLDELLYKDRLLFDYFDKNLAIIPTKDWGCFAFERAHHAKHGRSHNEVEQVRDIVFEHIRKHGATCSADLKLSDKKADWYWSATTLSRAALETFYFTGELGVHHKKGTVKYYDLIERLLPREILEKPYPFDEDDARDAWLVKRRIAAVGLLWNKPSDAFLCITNLKAERRNALFERLEKNGEIIPVEVEGIKNPLYSAREDVPILAQALSDDTPGTRCELLGPLDCFLWDRRLIRELFGYSYSWEIYTPIDKRKYGYYTLPILYGHALVGRIEPVADKKRGVLRVKNVWYEDGFKPDAKFKKALEATVKRLAALNDCVLEK